MPRALPCSGAALLCGPLLLSVLLSGCNGGKGTAGPTPVAATTPPPTVTPTASPTTSATPEPAVSAHPTLTPAPVVTRTTPPPLETAPPPGAPTCKAAALTVTDADTVTTARYVDQVYVIRTTGPDCGLKGFPTVVLKGADGAVLPVRYTHGGFGQAPDPGAAVSLSKGTSVSFTVSTTRAAGCPEAATIVVTLPGTAAAITAATTIKVCAGAAGVSPVHRLTDEG